MWNHESIVEKFWKFSWIVKTGRKKGIMNKLFSSLIEFALCLIHLNFSFGLTQFVYREICRKQIFTFYFFFIIYKRKRRTLDEICTFSWKEQFGMERILKMEISFPRRYHSILIYAYIIGYNIMHRLTLTFRISPNRWTSCACFIKYETSVSTHGDAYTSLFKILLKFLRKNLLKLRNHWKKNYGSYLNCNTLKKLFKGRIFFYLFKPLFSVD